MKEVTFFQSFDGKFFKTSEECSEHENNHAFMNPDKIIFYTDNGMKIPTPSEEVFLDSNRFKVFDENTLGLYRDYCDHLDIAAPSLDCTLTFPRHYKFYEGEWKCLEEEILQLELSFETDFGEHYSHNEEDHHNLA